MHIEDPALTGFKVYREKTSGIDDDRKATKAGFQIDDQADAGEYTIAHKGKENAWAFWPASSGQRHDIGSWAQATPAWLNSEGVIRPLLDKSQAVDTDYDTKAQSSSVGDAVTTCRVATETGDGTPGLLVACLNDSASEYFFFPISDSTFKVDTHTPDNSTLVYDVNADGSKNVSNVGKTSDMMIVYGNVAYLLYDVEFLQSSTKKGPLDLDPSGSYPSISTPGAPVYYAVKCVFHGGKWQWYVAVDTSTSTLYARIRWNYDIEQDLSEGELVTYNDASDEFVPTGTRIWIDQAKSRQVQFWTAGDYTIFEITLVKENVTRGTQTRHLYRVTQCVKDTGHKITHFTTEQQHLEGQLTGLLLSTDLDAAPWNNPESSYIETTIVSMGLRNKVLCKIPAQWQTVTDQNYKYLEASDFSRGQPLWFRPIRPTLDNLESEIYASGQLLSNDNPCAYYKRAEA